MTANQAAIVYDKIKEKIESGEYSPAQSLPEVALSKEYNVSRNTIKKVLLMLENGGYVTMDLNKGAKVASYSKEELLQFMDLREVLEGFIIRQAIPAFTEEDIAAMKEILDNMASFKAKSDLVSYSACNQKFHRIIYDACPNRPAAEITVNLKERMRKYNGKSILVPGRSDNSLEEHTAIYEAIRRRDADRAEELIRMHVHHVRDVLEQYYSFLF